MLTMRYQLLIVVRVTPVYTRDNMDSYFAYAWTEMTLFVNFYQTTVCI